MESDPYIFPKVTVIIPHGCCHEAFWRLTREDNTKMICKSRKFSSFIVPIIILIVEFICISTNVM